MYVCRYLSSYWYFWRLSQESYTIQCILVLSGYFLLIRFRLNILARISQSWNTLPIPSPQHTHKIKLVRYWMIQMELLTTDTGCQFGKMKQFCKWIVVMAAQLCECTWCHSTICLKTVQMVNLMLNVFYHNLKKEAWLLGQGDACSHSPLQNVFSLLTISKKFVGDTSKLCKYPLSQRSFPQWFQHKQGALCSKVIWILYSVYF